MCLRTETWYYKAEESFKCLDCKRSTGSYAQIGHGGYETRQKI